MLMKTSSVFFSSYRALFNKSLSINRHNLKQSTCLLPISVGQDAHEGLRFRATIDLLNDNFKSCFFLLGDELQRHTIPIYSNCDIKSAHSKSITNGDEWLLRNAPYLNGLKIPYSIDRWASMLSHKNYPRYLSYVYEESKKNLAFGKSIDNNVSDFFERFDKRNQSMHLDRNLATEMCKKYLLEECAAMFVWVEGGFNFELYPNGRSKAMDFVYNHYIKIAHPELLQPISLRFKSNHKEPENDKDGAFKPTNQ